MLVKQQLVIQFLEAGSSALFVESLSVQRPRLSLTPFHRLNGPILTRVCLSTPMYKSVSYSRNASAIAIFIAMAILALVTLPIASSILYPTNL